MNVGEIEYTVSVETQQSINAAQKFTRDMDKVSGASRKADASLGKFNGRTKKTADAVRRANGELSNQSKVLSSLTKMVGAYLSIRAVRSAIDLADRYEEMAGRIRDATDSTEEYNKVQDRLLAVANRSYRALGEIQEAYIQSSRGLRDMGYSTEEALDITESLSLAFVRNSTSSDKAASAMNALVRATNRGAVLTDHWASLLIAVPTIVDDIAAATGKTSQEISKLGYAGQLSAGMLTEGLRVAREENGRVADEMATTVSDAVTRLTNSFQVLIAKVNESSGATGGLSGAIDDLASILQDPKTVEAAVQLATGIATAFGGIIKGAREVVSITRWMAEEVAATFNGIASDDVVRLEQEADKIRKALEGGIMGMGERLRFFGPDGVVKFWSRSELEEELARIEKATEESYKRMGRNMPDSTPPPSADKPQVRNDLLNAETDATKRLTGARKQLTEAEREAIKAAEDLKRANESNEETLARLREAIYQTELTGRDLVERQAELSLNKYATPEQIAEVKALAAQLKNAQDQASLQVQAKSLDKEGSAQEAHQKELADLQEMLDLKMITEDEYRQYTLDSETALQQRLMELDEERYRSQSVAHDLLMSSLDSVGSHATDAFMDFATGAKTGTDAVMAMGQAIGQSVIRALVDMGVQMAVNAVKEKVFAAQSASTAAATGAAITAAYTPAAAAASVASFGGAAAAGLSSMSAAVPAMMSMFAVGSRRQGGPVAAGSMYRVNEGGAPEIFQNNLGQQYMMPNSRGEVISNKDASKGGGAGGTIVNIYEAANTSAEVTTTKDDQGREVIDIVLQNLLSDGELAGAVGRITGTQYQGV